MAKSPNSRYLDTIGDGTGERNMALLDGSVTPVILRVKPSAGEIYAIERIIITMTLAANNPNSGYGAQVANLTNGIELKVITGAAGGSTYWDISDNIPIVANHDWKRLCHDEIISTYGTTQSALSWRYTFTRDDGQVVLDGNNNDELQVIINDDLTSVSGLSEHYVRAGMVIK